MWDTLWYFVPHKKNKKKTPTGSSDFFKFIKITYSDDETQWVKLSQYADKL